MQPRFIHVTRFFQLVRIKPTSCVRTSNQMHVPANIFYKKNIKIQRLLMNNCN